MLDLELLRSFVSVVDAGGFTRAGERVHRTQSTVSQQIKRLEEDVGQPLLIRSGKDVTPTEAGERLLTYARRLLSLAEEAHDVLSRPGSEGAIRIGITEDFAAYRLTRLLATFARSHPTLRLDVRSGQSLFLYRDLERGDLDLALIKRAASEKGGIAVWPERVHWVTSKSHPRDTTTGSVPLFGFGSGCLYRAHAIHALERAGRNWYETIPLSIIVTKPLIITVCMQDTPVLHPFMEGTIRGFNTFMRSRFILQILYRNATMYLRYLRIIDGETDKLELRLRHSMQNREILMLLELSKTLVYFNTSLKSNEIVMEKLTTLSRIKQYPEDEDLLDDVITENKQAIEMANIYSGVLANMTDAFSSVVSNNLSNVMRIFTIISITLSIPTLIFSMYGMNFQQGMLGMPFTDSRWGFLVIIVLAIALSLAVLWFLTRSRLFK